MTATPPLPIETLHDGQNLYFTRPQMLAYGAACAAAEREACAALCDTTPPYPFRPSLEAAHAIRARKDTA